MLATFSHEQVGDRIEVQGNLEIGKGGASSFIEGRTDHGKGRTCNGNKRGEEEIMFVQLSQEDLGNYVGKNA